MCFKSQYTVDIFLPSGLSILALTLGCICKVYTWPLFIWLAMISCVYTEGQRDIKSEIRGSRKPYLTIQQNYVNESL